MIIPAAGALTVSPSRLFGWPQNGANSFIYVHGVFQVPSLLFAHPAPLDAS
jgi:hypothetical protein